MLFLFVFIVFLPLLTSNLARVLTTYLARVLTSYLARVLIGIPRLSGELIPRLLLGNWVSPKTSGMGIDSQKTLGIGNW